MDEHCSMSYCYRLIEKRGRNHLCPEDRQIQLQLPHHRLHHAPTLCILRLCCFGFVLGWRLLLLIHFGKHPLSRRLCMLIWVASSLMSGKALSCCFSRSLFFSQELHTKRRLYLGFGHISPFLWLHPIWPIQRQCLQSVSLHQMHVVGLGPGFFAFVIDPDRCFSSRFIR